jgi:hypothetical protein
VADNGGFFSISVTPDDRYPSGAFSHLSSISITNFEVVQATGPKEGPRSPGAPRVDAGVDSTAAPGTPFQLAGSVLYTNTVPLQTGWKVYSGPGAATFSDGTLTNGTVTFSALGEYVLMLSAEDGIHTPAYDAVKIAVVQKAIDNIAIQAALSGGNLVLRWSGNSASYTVQQASALPPLNWKDLTNVTAAQMVIPVSSTQSFFRVSGQP